MTIQVELLNRDQNRSVEVLYSDTVYGPEGPTDEKIESQAGILKPNEMQAFWIHSNRDLKLREEKQAG